MELLQLRYFCVVARHQNVTRAAAELMISQPALSKTIRSLEKELGTPLFERQGKYIHLNRIGEIFYENISKTLQLLDDSISTARDSSDTPVGEVRILVSAASTFIVPLYQDFQKRYPSIRLYLSNHVHYDQLSITDFDLKFFAVERYTPRKNTAPLLTERMMLAVPKRHPLAGHSVIDLADAAPYPFISSNARSYLEELCLQAGFSPNIILQCDNGYTYNKMLETGMGITLTPELTSNSLASGLTLVPFRNPSAQRTLVMSWNQNRYLSHAVRLFRQEALLFFQKRIAALGKGAPEQPRAL